MRFQHFTIKEAMLKIVEHKLYLPAIQRKFVWGTDQIERLFDSIMRDYPIGTFLFWAVSKQKRDDYVFYEFIRDYHERDCWKNELASKPHMPDELIGVLDGQQRLNSMFVALQGSFAYKKRYARWENDDSFPARRLYVNALKAEEEREEDEFVYEFKFLTDEEAGRADGSHAWCQVKEMLTFEELSDVREYWTRQSRILLGDNSLTGDQENLALRILEKLYYRLAREELVSYFEVKNQELDEVLDIFVRVNSGGTPLTKSDLLFSTIVAHWESGREEIEKFLDEINRVGQGFYFDTDFMMRACLVLSDAPVRLKVASFKEDNVRNIIGRWSEITDALRRMVRLLNTWGFSGETLSSPNATIPVAYCLLNGVSDEASLYDLKLYLVKSLVLGIFGASGDQVLTEVRRSMKTQIASGQSFSMATLEHSFNISNKTFRIDEEVLDDLLETTKGSLEIRPNTVPPGSYPSVLDLYWRAIGQFRARRARARGVDRACESSAQSATAQGANESKQECARPRAMVGRGVSNRSGAKQLQAGKLLSTGRQPEAERLQSLP